MMGRRIARVAVGIVVPVAAVWIGVSIWLCANIHQATTTCHWPLRTFTWLWPIWRIFPEVALNWIMKQAFFLCGFDIGDHMLSMFSILTFVGQFIIMILTLVSWYYAALSRKMQTRIHDLQQFLIQRMHDTELRLVELERSK